MLFKKNSKKTIIIINIINLYFAYTVKQLIQVADSEFIGFLLMRLIVFTKIPQKKTNLGKIKML